MSFENTVECSLTVCVHEFSFLFSHLVPDLNEFMQLHIGSTFSTYDHDVDNDEGNCAEKFRGGWWYNNCSHVSLL